MKKNSLKDMAKTQATYEKGAAKVKKAGGASAVRKMLVKKKKTTAQ